MDPKRATPHLKKRGAQINPASRFEKTRQEQSFEDREFDEDLQVEERAIPTTFLQDKSRTVLTSNDSPDIPFEYSINPYRGCEHGCTYCYARPTHEFLSMNAGSDFESKIMVKHDAAELLKARLSKPSWKPAPIAMSGVTDCYQPAERRFRITRSCLQVLLEHRNPVSLITKNVLILRDLDLLAEMARLRLVHVYMSITTLDPALAASMEPRTATPQARLQAVQALSEKGLPVGVMMAPLIPGLNDLEIPTLLGAASQAGAKTAHYVLLRLPLAVKPIFLDWLGRSRPGRAAKIKALLQDVRSGTLNDASFGSRMTGRGPVAANLARTFELFAKRFELDQGLPDYDLANFRHQPGSGVQLELFPR